jgi:hypothetical protein
MQAKLSFVMRTRVLLVPCTNDVADKKWSLK